MVCGRCGCWVKHAQSQWQILPVGFDLPPGIVHYRIDSQGNTVYIVCQRCVNLQELDALVSIAITTKRNSDLKAIDGQIDRLVQNFRQLLLS